MTTGITTEDLQQEPEVQEDRGKLWSQADAVLRENPIPAVLTAVALGFGIGLIVRALEPKPKSHPIRDCLDETGDYLGSLFRPFAKKARRGYSASTRGVRDVIGRAADKAQDVAGGDYLDPVARWWKRLWS